MLTKRPLTNFQAIKEGHPYSKSAATYFEDMDYENTAKLNDLTSGVKSKFDILNLPENVILNDIILLKRTKKANEDIIITFKCNESK